MGELALKPPFNQSLPKIWFISGRSFVPLPLVWRWMLLCCLYYNFLRLCSCILLRPGSPISFFAVSDTEKPTYNIALVTRQASVLYRAPSSRRCLYGGSFLCKLAFFSLSSWYIGVIYPMVGGCGHGFPCNYWAGSWTIFRNWLIKILYLIRHIINYFI